jgi:ethanolamine ammonia-lyase small subunit
MNEDTNYIKPVTKDAWSSLRNFTPARIALGRSGISVPSQEVLRFKMDHAYARDAVFSLMDVDTLLSQLQLFNLPIYVLKSKAADKHTYLKRPDLGRKLHQDSMNRLNNLNDISYDVCITITDGLSAIAINNHCMHVLSLLIPLLVNANINTAPLCVVKHGRVAIADETSSLLKAKLALLFVGERPGLSAHDSMGVYLTYNPRPGLTDESRNCISNIRPEGLQYQPAADKIFYLIRESLRLQLSGIWLKENNANDMLE